MKNPKFEGQSILCMCVCIFLQQYCIHVDIGNSKNYLGINLMFNCIISQHYCIHMDTGNSKNFLGINLIFYYVSPQGFIHRSTATMFRDKHVAGNGQWLKAMSRVQPKHRSSEVSSKIFHFIIHNHLFIGSKYPIMIVCRFEVTCTG